MPLYRILVSIFALVACLRALREGGVALLRARLGMVTPPVAAPHLWWHGASNGELASGLPVLKRLLAARPGMRVLVTANSATGVALARGWALPGVSVHPAPLDLDWVTRRVMRRWCVHAHITLESELWPHRVLRCPGPVILLGARLRPGTARAWGRMPRLAARVLGRVAFASAQDAASRGRLVDLGLPRAACGPIADLKALYVPPALPDAHTPAFDRATTWLAASTHEGEEAVVLRAHSLARARNPALRLILAPRHPRRADAIAAAVTSAGFGCARRSRGETPVPCDVYLADTMGEMARWYARAGRVFIGGTLAPRGGHTPFEPAAFGAALIHGPEFANFADAFARLDGIARRVTDAESLAAALAALDDPTEQARAGAAAAHALRAETDLAGLCDAILGHLPVNET